MFRLAGVLAPLLLLTVLELGLRVAGFGYPTDFFLKKSINGREVYVENDRFGLRFFPPELARSPSPIVMPARKGEHTYRIFILGESAALGDPEPAFGFGRYLQVLLNERFPGARFEVVCTAMTAVNSHAILPIARDCARHEGDLWIIYMGNNEFVGPFGAGTIFGPKAPGLGFIRFNVGLQATRIGQLLAALQRNLKGGPRLSSWRGMEMFLENQVGPDDPRKPRVYEHFQKNLEDILRVSERAGVKVIVSTVASNLRDCAPFASENSPDLDTNKVANWKRLFDEGAGAERAGDFPKAVSNYLAAAKIDSSFADLHFRLGRSYLAATNFPEARSHFELARDLDALPFRADTRLNQIIKATALKHASDGVHFVDVVPSLGRQGIPGRELFFEHVHFNFEGNYLLARTIAEEMLPLLPDSIAKQNSGAWASAERCAQRLALTDWDRRRVHDAVLRRLSEAPFVNQTDHSEQIAALQKERAGLRSRLTSAAAPSARADYQSALADDPDDFYLRADFAKLLEDTGDLAGAASEWQRLRELLPHEPAPYFFAGKLLARTGKADEALQCFSRTLEIRPDFPDALEEKGQLLLRQKKAREALPLFEKALRLQPGNARICVEMADALAQLNRRPEALDKLREAVRLQPAYWEARYLLGVELATDGRIQQAAEQFSEVVQANPSHVSSHLNLAIAWAKLGKMDDATKEFRETLRLDPNNRKALEYFKTVQELQKREQH